MLFRSQWVDYYWYNSLVISEQSFRSDDFKQVNTFIRRAMAEHPEGVVVSWDLPVNNVLPDYCILPQKEVIELMQRQGVIDLSAFERCVREGRLRYAVTRASAPPPELFGVRLPRSRSVFHAGSLLVFKFDEG